jgi:hypothetical protein
MAQKYLMQARSSEDGLLYAWSAESADFEGAGFPGPGSPEEVAVSIAPSGGGGSADFPGISFPGISFHDTTHTSVPAETGTVLATYDFDELPNVRDFYDEPMQFGREPYFCSGTVEAHVVDIHSSFYGTSEQYYIEQQVERYYGGDISLVGDPEIRTISSNPELPSNIAFEINDDGNLELRYERGLDAPGFVTQTTIGRLADTAEQVPTVQAATWWHDSGQYYIELYFGDVALDPESLPNLSSYDASDAGVEVSGYGTGDYSPAANMPVGYLYLFLSDEPAIDTLYLSFTRSGSRLRKLHGAEVENFTNLVVTLD